jgi:chromosome segregation ATPase
VAALKEGKGFSIMFRKIAIAVGAVLLGLVIVSYTHLPSLCHVKWNDATAWLDRQVPVETKIKQLRIETDKIDNEIKANLGKLAKLEVETQNLEQNAIALKGEQADRKAEIAKLASELERKTEQVAGNKKDIKPLTNKLDLAVSTYEVRDAKLKNLESLLTAKRQTLEAAHQKISAMKDQRDELRVTIAKLETRKELVDIKTQQSTVQFSDSKIADCNRLAKEISDQLSEREKVADLMHQYGYTNDKGAAVEKEGKNVKDVLNSAKKVLSDNSQEDQ